MTRGERKELVRKIMGRMPSIFGGKGCRCASCRETSKYRQLSFEEWPRGNPAGAKAKLAYSSHVSFNWREVGKAKVIVEAGAAFYGTPAGMTKVQVAEVLRHSFEEVQNVGTCG